MREGGREREKEREREREREREHKFSAPMLQQQLSSTIQNDCVCHFLFRQCRSVLFLLTGRKSLVKSCAERKSCSCCMLLRVALIPTSQVEADQYKRDGINRSKMCDKQS